MTFLLCALLALSATSIDPSPSSQPTPTPSVQNEQQPADKHGPADPLVDKQQAETNQRPAEKEDREGYKPWLLKFADRYGNAINALSTLVMAVFTVALFVSTHLLWKSGEKHSERELRAYVCLDGVTTPAFQGSTETRALIRNRGQTPAYDLKVVATFDLHALPRTEFLPYRKQQPNQSSGLVGPDSEISMVLAGVALTPERVQALRDGTCALFFYGRVDYRDAFGRNRFTNFRHIGTLHPVGAITWDVTETGNDAS